MCPNFLHHILRESARKLTDRELVCGQNPPVVNTKVISYRTICGKPIRGQLLRGLAILRRYSVKM